VKILCIDIETTPNLAHVWELWQTNVGLPQLLKSSEMLCFGAKWLDGEPFEFRSVFHDGKGVMVRRVHSLLDEADVAMHYNGRLFDVPNLNREIVQAGLLPPAPFKQLDLWSAVKKQFYFPSYKLAYVLKAFGLKPKGETGGHQLWIDCMAGKPEAWARMEEYNRRDVFALEDLYHVIRPWIPGHPNHALYEGTDVCPACASGNLRPQGYAYTAVGKFQRYRCADCGKWSRAGRRSDGADIREVAA